MGWLTEKPKDSFLKPRNAKGATFLRPDVKREEAAGRIQGEHHLREVIHHLERQPETLEATHESQIAAFHASTATSNATEKLAGIALNREMDVATHNLVRLEQEKSKIDVEKAAQLAQIDVQKARELTRLELVKQRIEARTKLKTLVAARQIKELLDGPDRKADSGGELRGLHQADSDD